MNARRAASMPLVALLFLPICAFAQLSDPSSGNRECSKCSDLCYLVDQYWQKERGIKVWKRYATTTPPLLRTALPAKVTDFDSFNDFIYGEELPNAWKGQSLPCKAVEEWEKTERPKSPMRPPDGTGLETKVFDGSCETFYGGKKLEGDTEKKWRATHVCKGSADAEIEHEKVHQRICRDTWAQGASRAAGRLSAFENVAQGELQAWIWHRNLLRDEILKLAKNCGWEPTDRQKANPNSVPTPHQTKEMEDLGWKAFKALTP